MSITTRTPPTGEAWDMDDTAGFWRSRRTLAAGLVLACAAGAGVWAVGHGSGHEHPAGKPAAAAYDSACGLTGGDTGMPTKAPDLQWQNIDASWQPVSPTQGPGVRTANGAWSCFAHTPTGAVLAAWTIPARMGVAENFAGIVKQQTVPGPGQTLLLQRGQSKHHASDQVVPFGFKINGYAQDVATVTFYGRQSGVGVRCTTAVQWAGGATGDWLLRLAPDGSGLLDCERLLADLQNSDFVAWGPNQ